MITSSHIAKMVEGISESTKNVIVRSLRAELTGAITSVNKLMEGRNEHDLSPHASLILAAFQHCDLQDCGVVLLGQDPYIGLGEAMGLSFSVPRGARVPPSLKNIFGALQHVGLIAGPPSHGDLTAWARQGVLLLNAALTTLVGTSNAHEAAWAKYTDALIGALGAATAPPRVFILLGNFAKGKAKLIATHHTVLSWGHPSPQSSANQSDNPANFKYCDVFAKTNAQLARWGRPQINWDPCAPAATNPPIAALCESTPQIATPARLSVVSTPRPAGGNDPAPSTTDTLWIFTDGGSRANGKDHCEASWAFYATDGCNVMSQSGLVPHGTDTARATNNRGELTAILRALEFAATTTEADFDFKHIMIVSDSKYSIGATNVWGDAWEADPVGKKMKEKKNLDLITSARQLLKQLRQDFHVDFKHTRSHQPEPASDSDDAWFVWCGNNIADKLCTSVLQM